LTEFAAVSRKVAEHLGIESIDPVSHRPNQVCFAPACCSDATMLFEEHKGPPLDVDATLAQYEDWQDRTQWPKASSEIPEQDGGTSRLGDPRDAPGYRGAFCRAFDVLEAIEKFELPFESTGNEWRLTPHGATGHGGARIYAPPNDPTHAAYIYNDHQSGIRPKRNSCSYDLVRVHKFGDLDKDAPEGTNVKDLPSTIAMKDWIRKEHPEVAADVKLTADAEFDALGPEPEPPPASEEPEPSEDDSYDLIDCTDQGNANLLVQLADSNLRYVAEKERWMTWVNNRWQVDEHEVFSTGFALKVANHYAEKAEKHWFRKHAFAAKGSKEEAEREAQRAIYCTKWAEKCRSKSRIASMLELARKIPGVPISAAELDRSPWLLGVQNGVVDLRTGKLRADAREDMVTRRCSIAFNPEAKAPRWLLLIDEVTGSPIDADYDEETGEVISSTVGRYIPRPALARYSKKMFGYCTTGARREQKFFLGLGKGSNGKNLVCDTVKRVLGDYSRLMTSEVLMASKRPSDPERPSPIIADLAGARFVFASETKDNSQLDANVIKAHTGNAEVVARGLFVGPTTFQQTHKILLCCNKPPRMDQLDDAIIGRLHSLPFDRKWNRPGHTTHDPAFPDGDKNLEAALAAEDEGVLLWLVQGALLYQEEGLDPPPEVVVSTTTYLDEQDVLGRWLEELVQCEPTNESLRASELFTEFRNWCKSQGERTALTSQKAFSDALGRRKIPSRRLNTGQHYGLRKKPEFGPVVSTEQKSDSLQQTRAALIQCQTRNGGDHTVPSEILAKYATTGTLDSVPEAHRETLISDCAAACVPPEEATTTSEPNWFD
jgi:putative DNA primase/helicase